jgi:hypothetical protein
MNALGGLPACPADVVSKDSYSGALCFAIFQDFSIP